MSNDKITKGILACYNTDASRIKGNAIKVVFPKIPEEVQRAVRESNLDIVPRGCGSSLVGGCIPNNSLVVDTGKLNSVVNFDSGKKSVYVGAGITVKELNERLNPLGYEFPVFLLNKEFSTIGGMISLNILGDRSMKYGAIKDWVEEIDFVNGRGELIKAGKSDLMDVCGMEGVTGIIIGAKLKVYPLVKRSASILQSDDLDEIFSIARRLKLEKETTMLRFLSKQVSEMLGFPGKYHLIIEFNSQRGKIKGREYKKLLRNLKKSFYIIYSEGYYYNEDPKFFFDKIKEFVLLLERRKIPYLGDLGTGIIHPFFKDTDNEKKEEIANFLKKIKIKISKYGYGLTRKDYFEDSEKKILHRVKLRHDPFGKMNGGKFIETAKEEELVRKSFADDNIIVRASLGEEKSARDVLENFKTPDEKLMEFIEAEAEREEEIKKENQMQKVAEEDEDTKIQNKIKDYEQTFSSELDFEKRIRIEDFARGVPREIARKKETDANYDEIKDIMTNKYGFDAGKLNFDAIKKDKENIKRNQETDFSDYQKDSFKDNAENKKGKVTSEEQDIINKIMMNKVSSEEKKNLDKEDRKN